MFVDFLLIDFEPRDRDVADRPGPALLNKWTYSSSSCTEPK
jgi:hypothetical protein